MSLLVGLHQFTVLSSENANTLAQVSDAAAIQAW
jgi:hypothetical protein